MLLTTLESGGPDRPSVDAQRRANDRLWRRKGLVKAYATRVLRPVEVILLVRYREALSGRVLELGCGAGRVTGYLGEIAHAAVGMDISPEMVAYCRRTYPNASFIEGDIRNLESIAPGSFDAIVATSNVLDVLGDGERRLLLDRIHQVLAPNGLLIFSSHNLANAPRRVQPLQAQYRGLLWTARALVNWPRWQRNRRRLLPFEKTVDRYAILNDISHDFLALHYYTSRDAQEGQLAEQGFDLVECLDLDGRRVEAGEDAPGCAELHYVARHHPGTATI